MIDMIIVMPPKFINLGWDSEPAVTSSNIKCLQSWDCLDLCYTGVPNIALRTGNCMMGQAGHVLRCSTTIHLTLTALAACLHEHEHGSSKMIPKRPSPWKSQRSKADARSYQSHPGNHDAREFQTFPSQSGIVRSSLKRDMSGKVMTSTKMACQY